MRRRQSVYTVVLITLLLVIACLAPGTVSAGESSVKLYHQNGDEKYEYKDCTWKYGENIYVYEDLFMDEEKQDSQTETYKVKVDSVIVKDSNVLKIRDMSESSPKKLIEKGLCPFCGSSAKITPVESNGTMWYYIVCSVKNCRSNMKSDWSEEQLNKANDITGNGRWRITAGESGKSEVVINYMKENGDKGVHTFTVTVPVYHKVTFRGEEGNGEVIYDIQYVADGKAAKQPEYKPTRAGYIFDGWDADFDNVTSDLTVNALWKKGTFSGFKITNIVNGQEIIWDCDENGTLTVSGTGCALIIGSEKEEEFAKYKNEIRKVIIKEGIVGIGSYTFKDCVNLSEVTFPKGLEIIYSSAFEGCVQLCQVEFPETLKEIGQSAFKGCIGIVKIELPESMKSLLEEAFSGCTGLKEVTLPESLEYIDENVFNGCSADCIFYVYKDSEADKKITGNKSYIIIDKEAPVVESLSLDKKNVTVGDVVTVTMVVTDQSGVKDNFHLTYNMGTHYKYITMSHIKDDTYQGKLEITEDFVNGEYGPVWVFVYDNLGNGGADYLRAFRTNTFLVTGAITDAESPELISLCVDKDEAVRGDVVTYELTLKEESGLNGKPNIGFKNTSGEYKYVYFDSSKAEKKDDIFVLKATVTLDDFFSTGRQQPEWLISCSDIYGNTTSSFSVGEEFPESHFTIYDDEEYLEIPQLKNTVVFYDDFTIKDRTIEGDLYIGPDSVTTLKNVIVNGNIYVIGGLNAESVKADTIHARSITMSSIGSWSKGNGRVCLSGTNSISDLVCSNFLIEDMPLWIEEPIKSVDGKLDLKGITPEVADLYVNGQKIETVNGKFIIKGFDVSDTDVLTFSWKSDITYIDSKVFTIEKYVTASDGTLNALPVITASDKTYCVNTDIDYTKNVSAMDKENGDISESIQVDASQVNLETPGRYTVTYSVTDSQGGMQQKKAYVTIVEHKFDEGIVTTEATCEKEGVMEFTCNRCQCKVIKSIEPIGHDWDSGKIEEKASCIEDGIKKYSCKRDGCMAEKTEVIPAIGHNWSDDFEIDKQSSCTEEGSKSRHCENESCNEKTDIMVIPAKGHIKGTEKITEANFFRNGKSIVRCANCEEIIKEEILYYKESSMRIAGDNRYATSTAAADTLKQSLDVDKFENIIVASGDDYPDALAGSYLAKVKNAPVMLVGKDVNTEADVKQYINKNLKKGGTVYLLGGTGVVTSRFEKSLGDLKVERLGGQTRYETNIAILKAAGVDKEDLLVCTGEGFADSLSASAVGKPILLVAGSGVDDTQKKYLGSLKIKDIYLIGGTGVVSDKIGTQLKKYDQDDKCERVAGQNRYLTSVAVAKEFFPKGSDSAVLAYAMNFPDGLAGGPLALSMKAPLILTDNSGYSDAVAYAKSAGIKKAAVLGGPTLIPDSIVNRIVN